MSNQQDGDVGGMFINAGPLLSIAETVRDRVADATEPRKSGTLEALTAVLFAIAAMEAFINEAAELASLATSCSSTPLPPEVASFRDLVRLAEEERSSLRTKYLLAHVALTGHPFNDGRPPFQDFGLLVSLRNEIAHYKPRERFSEDARGGLRVEPPRILAQLRARHITAQLEPGVQTTWLNVVATPAVAHWACSVARGVVTAIMNAVPSGDFRDRMEFFYCLPFRGRRLDQ